MWWLLLPLAAAAAKVVYDALQEEDIPSIEPTILERNLERLSAELASFQGFKVAILGQPGAGKSSLLKKMTDSKVKPLPVIGAETDATNWSQDPRCNLLSIYKNNTAFVDFPGYGTSSHPTETFQQFPFDEFDAFIFVVRGKLHSADADIFYSVSHLGRPCIVTRSYSESLDQEERSAATADIAKHLRRRSSDPVYFFSNRTGVGIREIFEKVRSARTSKRIKRVA